MDKIIDPLCRTLLNFNTEHNAFMKHFYAQTRSLTLPNKDCK